MSKPGAPLPKWLALLATGPCLLLLWYFLGRVMEGM